MPSDERVGLALQALERPIADFRAALTGALDQAGAFLATQRGGAEGLVERMRVELGVFGARHVDPARFADYFAARPSLDDLATARLERAVATLRSLLDRGAEAFVATVPSGGSLGQTVGAALADVGRAFGAVLAVELLRNGAFTSDHEPLLESFAFHSWTKTERRFAPPLVVKVAGADLQVGGLADYLDGREKIVLVVEGPAAPAPLVRLITPGTLVLQTHDGGGLDRMASAEGPAVAALMPETSAVFLHDPTAGRESWQRLSVAHVPPSPRKAVGGFSTWQMQEDIRQLEALAAAPLAQPLPSGAAPAAGGADAVDKLASWLLGQADAQGPA